MIIGIGTDIIEIDRFIQWHNYATKQLCHVYSQQEIEYCLSNPIKSAERFAVRFAAREALFKAISSTAQSSHNPFLKVCKAITINRDQRGVCRMAVDWDMLCLPQLVKANIHLSMSHNRSQAIAIVVLEQ